MCDDDSGNAREGGRELEREEARAGLGRARDAVLRDWGRASEAVLVAAGAGYAIRPDTGLLLMGGKEWVLAATAAGCCSGRNGVLACARDGVLGPELPVPEFPGIKDAKDASVSAASGIAYRCAAGDMLPPSRSSAGDMLRGDAGDAAVTHDVADDAAPGVVYSEDRPSVTVDLFTLVVERYGCRLTVAVDGQAIGCVAVLAGRGCCGIARGCSTSGVPFSSTSASGAVLFQSLCSVHVPTSTRAKSLNAEILSQVWYSSGFGVTSLTRDCFRPGWLGESTTDARTRRTTTVTHCASLSTARNTRRRKWRTRGACGGCPGSPTAPGIGVVLPCWNCSKKAWVRGSCSWAGLN